jgi:hypothetical protein
MSDDVVPLPRGIEEGGAWVVARVAFTGFNIHLRTCRFKFDATPNRRPQVSHTNATKIRNRNKSASPSSPPDGTIICTHPFHLCAQADAAELINIITLYHK